MSDLLSSLKRELTADELTSLVLRVVLEPRAIFAVGWHARTHTVSSSFCPPLARVIITQSHTQTIERTFSRWCEHATWRDDADRGASWVLLCARSEAETFRLDKTAFVVPGDQHPLEIYAPQAELFHASLTVLDRMFAPERMPN